MRKKTSYRKQGLGKCCCTVLMAAAVFGAFGLTARAATRYIDLEPDMENLPEHNAGEAFLPVYELTEGDEDGISIAFGDGPETTADPTLPYSLKIYVSSDNGALDEALEIRGKGIRYTYVDQVSMDNTEAEGRLLVYPFYRLMAPGPMLDTAFGRVSWDAVPYAGKYEYLVSWEDAGGEEKQRHGTTKQTFVDISSELAKAQNGRIGVAVRALATEEEGFTEAEIRDGIARWDSMEWADKYRIRIEFTDLTGRKFRQEKTVSGNSCNVAAYISSAMDREVRVTVRAVPRKNDHSYYNISLSEFGTAGFLQPDTSDYDVENPWDFLADYTAVVDGNFAAYSRERASGAAGTGAGGPAANGSWHRVSYRWQYRVDGSPFHNGWILISGSWYYFDPDGFMHTGWLWDTDGRKYYLETKVGAEQGRMITGEREIDGVMYSFDESGALRSGF